MANIVFTRHSIITLYTKQKHILGMNGEPHTATRTNFTKGLWAHDWNRIKILLAFLITRTFLFLFILNSWAAGVPVWNIRHAIKICMWSKAKIVLYYGRFTDRLTVRNRFQSHGLAFKRQMINKLSSKPKTIYRWVTSKKKTVTPLLMYWICGFLLSIYRSVINACTRIRLQLNHERENCEYSENGPMGICIISFVGFVCTA